MLWDVDVWKEMDRLRSEMDSLFTGYGRAGGTATYPLVNVFDDNDNMIVTAELPGLTRDQVSITFSEDVLTIAGKHDPLACSRDMAVVRRERSAGEFEKTIRIPVKVEHDKISASFSNGVLSIKLPKAEEVKPKTIAIEVK